MAIQRHNVGKRLSEIVVHNGVAYLAGEVPAGGVRGLQAVLDRVGASAQQD